MLPHGTLIEGHAWHPETALILKNCSKSLPELPPCLLDLGHVFDASRENKLPNHSSYDFEFKLTVNLVKVRSQVYPLTLKEDEALDNWIAEMEPKGWIFKAPSPVCSPLLFVEKSDGSLRPCVDYGNVNNVPVPEPHPIPIEAQIARYIEKARVFSKLDCLNAFNQIRIKEGQE